MIKRIKAAIRRLAVPWVVIFLISFATADSELCLGDRIWCTLIFAVLARLACSFGAPLWPIQHRDLL